MPDHPPVLPKVVVRGTLSIEPDGTVDIQNYRFALDPHQPKDGVGGKAMLAAMLQARETLGQQIASLHKDIYGV